MGNLDAILPDGTLAVLCESSGIVLIVDFDRNHNAYSYSLLDRLAELFLRKRPKKLTRGQVVTVCNLLNQQADKLQGMSETYRLISVAINNNPSILKDIAKIDDVVRKRIDNPFIEP